MIEALALLIPITALMIPITAILVHSPVGKAWARRLEAGSTPAAEAELATLRFRVSQLEAQQHEQTLRVQQLQESSDFYQQLLDSPDRSKPPRD